MPSRALNHIAGSSGRLDRREKLLLPWPESPTLSLQLSARPFCQKWILQAGGTESGVSDQYQTAVSRKWQPLGCNTISERRDGSPPPSRRVRWGSIHLQARDLTARGVRS